MQLPVKEMGIKDVKSIITLSKTKILYLIFPKYNEQLWLDFWNHPQVIEHFIKPNKQHIENYGTEVNTPNKFKKIYTYYNDTNKHIVINYLTKDYVRLPITQSTLNTENPHESVIKYIGIDENNTQVIRLIDAPEEHDLENLLFGGDIND